MEKEDKNINIYSQIKLLNKTYSIIECIYKEVKEKLTIHANKKDPIVDENYNKLDNTINKSEDKNTQMYYQIKLLNEACSVMDDLYIGIKEKLTIYTDKKDPIGDEDYINKLDNTINRLELYIDKCNESRKVLKDIIYDLPIISELACEFKDKESDDALTESLFKMKMYKDGYAIERYIGFEDDSVINIPNTYKEMPVIAILDKAFNNCKSITTVKLGKYINIIGEFAFSSCKLLSEIIFNEQLEIICHGAFSNCENIKEIKLPQSLAYIGDYAFGGTGIINVDIPLKVKFISGQLFYKCVDLVSVTLPEGIICICRKAFSDCYKLQRINIPFSTQGIDSEAFINCKMLRNIYIPKNVNFLGDNIFAETYIIQPDRRYNPRIGYSNLSDVVIQCDPGSKAQEYARSERLNFERANIRSLEPINEFNFESAMLVKILPFSNRGPKLENLSDETIIKIEEAIGLLGYKCYYINKKIYFTSPIRLVDEDKIEQQIYKIIGNYCHIFFNKNKHGN